MPILNLLICLLVSLFFRFQKECRVIFSHSPRHSKTKNKCFTTTLCHKVFYIFNLLFNCQVKNGENGFLHPYPFETKQKNKLNYAVKRITFSSTNQRLTHAAELLIVLRRTLFPH